MNNEATKLLASISRVVKGIDDRIDWYLLYASEANKEHKKLYYQVYLNKCRNLKEIAKKEIKNHEE